LLLVVAWTFIVQPTTFMSRFEGDFSLPFFMPLYGFIACVCCLFLIAQKGELRFILLFGRGDGKTTSLWINAEDLEWRQKS